MKRQQPTKIVQALSSQNQTSVLTPKRLVSSLHRVLWQSINSQTFTKAMLCGAMGILPLSLGNSVQASELDVYEVNSPTIENSGPVVMLTMPNSNTMSCGSIIWDNRYDEDKDIASHFEDMITTKKLGGVFDSNRPTQEVLQYGIKCQPHPIQIKLRDESGKVKQTITYQGQKYVYKGRTFYPRMTKMVMGLNDLFEHPEWLPKGTKLGLAYYGFGGTTIAFNFVGNFFPLSADSSLRDDDNGKFYSQVGGTKQSGLIAVPAGALTTEQLNKLKIALSTMTPESDKPIAKGYNEVVAYMLGSTTIDKTKTDEVLREHTRTWPIRRKHDDDSDDDNDVWEMCIDFQAPTAPFGGEKTPEGSPIYHSNCRTAAGDSWATLPKKIRQPYLDLLDKVNENYVTKQGGTTGPDSTTGTSKYTYYRFTHVWTGERPSNPNLSNPTSRAKYINSESGIFSSVLDSKVNINTADIHYKSPLKDQECSASGIYFLTDGYADSDRVRNLKMKPVIAELQAEQVFTNYNMIKNLTGNDKETFACEPETDTFYQGQNDHKLFNGLGGTAWRCSLPLAKKLAIASANRPAIKTAIVGYGGDYTKSVTFTKEDDKKGYVAISDCSGLDTDDTLKRDPFLACSMASEQFGAGGFFVAKDGKGVAQTIVDFANSLVGDYKPQPGDGLTVAIDPTNSTATRSFAYLPMLLPRPGTSKLVWQGNLKSYHIKNGTLYDASEPKKSIFQAINGQIKSDTMNIWNDGSDDGGDILKGGAYGKLLAPPPKTRTVFVEDKTTPTVPNAQIGVGADLKNIGWDKIPKTGVITPAANLGNLGYGRQVKHYLLNFLGFNDVPVNVDDSTAYPDADGKKDPLIDLSDYNSSMTKVMGGINNGKPQEVLYKYEKEKGEDAKETYKVLFGTMDGALHLVDAKTGEEEFSFIPNVFLKDNPRQLAALKYNNSSSGGLVYGVDAPWYISTKYHREIKDGKLIIKAKVEKDTKNEKGYVKAYGGLGRGGIGIYGLNITDFKNPKLLFHVTQSSNEKNPLSRLSNTWSKPSPAKIAYHKAGASGEKGETVDKDVLFVTGGYDMCYDIPNFTVNVDPTTITDSSDIKTIEENGTKIEKPKTLLDQIKDRDMEEKCLSEDKTKTKKTAEGNAVYMIDANSGELLWSTSSENMTSPDNSKYIQNKNMVNSIVGEVSVIDKDHDNRVDAIYFSDLGGQVFRADFDNSVAINQPKPTPDPTTGATPEAKKWSKRVVRILDTTQDGTEANGINNPALRFYHRPVVSVHRINESNELVESGGTPHLLVTVASGDRSNPLAKSSQRAADKSPNKLISIWDTDFSKPTEKWLNLEIPKEGSTNKDKELKIYNLTLSDLQALNWKAEGAEKGLSNDQKTQIRTGVKKGWYDNLTYFSGSSSDTDNTITAINSAYTVTGDNVSYLKVISQPRLRASRLFIPVYNRLAYIASKNSCSPAPTGVSEAQEYCLPFGVCTTTTTTTTSDGAGGTTATETTTQSRGKSYVLGSGIGSVTIAAGSGEKAKIISPEEADEDTVKDAFYSLYKLIPHRWFEQLSAESTDSESADSTGGED